MYYLIDWIKARLLFQRQCRPNGVVTKEGVEYYQLWRSTGGSHSSPESLYETLYPMPPPLPPRAAHRPLHRSNALPSGAPELPKRHPQRHPTPLHPEDCFGFEIVDVDEASNLKVKRLSLGYYIQYILLCIARKNNIYIIYKL